MKKIVVTGALGHIGSRLIRALPDAFPGTQIVMLDNLSTQRYCSLFNLPDRGAYRFIEGDVLTADLAPILSGAEVVIHLAAMTDAPSSFADPEKVRRVNCGGTERVAEACIQAGCPLIFISTTSVYGVKNGVVDENCPAADIKPQSPYAESKFAAEQLLIALGETKGLNFATCRFGTIVGASAGMRFHTAVNKFCWQAVMGQPLTVWRTALNQQRPYLDLGDAIEAMTFIMRKRLYDRRLYNVVTTNAAVSEIVGIISSHVPGATVKYVDTQIMNQLSYTVSNDRFRALGFEFRGNLEKGIHETVKLIGSLQA